MDNFAAQKTEKLKENQRDQNQNPAKNTSVVKDKRPQMVCKFEELKGDFLIRREIGRGSYGVVFKALRADETDMDATGKRR
jgi:hypothetical protein